MQGIVCCTGSRVSEPSGNQHRPPHSQGSGHQQGYPCFCHSQSPVKHKESPSSSPHTLFTLLHCLFCIASISFSDTPYKNIKLQYLINLQEQLKNLVRKSHTLQEYVSCSVITPAGSYSAFPQGLMFPIMILCFGN